MINQKTAGSQENAYLKLCLLIPFRNHKCYTFLKEFPSWNLLKEHVLLDQKFKVAFKWHRTLHKWKIQAKNCSSLDSFKLLSYEIEPFQQRMWDKNKFLRYYLDWELLLKQLSVPSSHWTASLNLMPFRSLHSPQASQPAWLQVHNHLFWFPGY